MHSSHLMYMQTFSGLTGCQSGGPAALLQALLGSAGSRMSRRSRSRSRTRLDSDSDGSEQVSMIQESDSICGQFSLCV